MASLPSYQDAVGRSDWLELVAPHAFVADFANLCLVSKRFYHFFCPRLWADPLRAVRLLGLDPADDLRWYFRFILKHVRAVRLSTRSLVLSLDLRGFAILSSEFDLDDGEGSVSATFRHLPSLFPHLRCILLNGHSDLDPGTLFQPSDAPSLRSSRASSFQSPLMLSIPHCRTQLPPTFFSSPYLENLVFLDVSDTTGSLKSTIARSLQPACLPCLRILKAQGREIDSATAIALFNAFRGQLWSLDLSRNNVTDAALDSLGQLCFPPVSLRSDAHFGVEGTTGLATGVGTDTYGPFVFLQESDWSATFSHPLRHMADTPIYTREAYRPLYSGSSARHHGRVGITRDTVEDIKQALAGPFHSPRIDPESARRLDICDGRDGITHLYLDQNPVTAQGLERLIRSSPGQLQRLECSATSLRTPIQVLPPSVAKNVRLSGLLGAAYLIRPVFSPNLQVLRVHHSLVTQVPSLETDNLVTMANVWLAETLIHERAKMAYPQAFVPDMNPRLQSLTLTNVPRFSAGPVIRKLVEFLQFAASQEQAIMDARQSSSSSPSSRRNPVMLRGLRHIRFEFDPDPTEELGHTLDSENLDAEQTINVTGNEFSFFGDQDWGTSPAPDQSQSVTTGFPQRLPVAGPSPRTDPSVQTELGDAPLGEMEDEDHLKHYESWKGNRFTVPVWVGSGVPGRYEAVNEYMRLLRGDRALRTNVGPVSPGHVLAGAPIGSYIFHAAWDAILSPTRTAQKPTRAELVGMRDVLAAIKDYRGRTRSAFETARKHKSAGPSSSVSHRHWTGQLEVSLADPNYSSKFWR